ncbi:helix-turn-helix domain-containing protein [Herbiconiux sp. CPCC 205763]|uniref:Helix-turn-helix domain-containing protein n=1 Tax=Herbiconiux aconitum TaxID=2970913 RepID=A0ABT2GW32_9MICO|nr:helix-turn-helix transcriptional regulator [Herbiconiux aconitum]MCS5719101.1 helix-turn-helix domain-containing protein [Herbiconiux aconitum]
MRADELRQGDGETATSDEVEERLGARIRSLRLSKNLNQAAVAERAGVSVRTVKNLENGRGSSVATLVRVVRALGRSDWFDALQPVVAISPLRMLAQERRDSSPQRASRPRSNSRRGAGAGAGAGDGVSPGAGSDADGSGR